MDETAQKITAAETLRDDFYKQNKIKPLDPSTLPIKVSTSRKGLILWLRNWLGITNLENRIKELEDDTGRLVEESVKQRYPELYHEIEREVNDGGNSDQNIKTN